MLHRADRNIENVTYSGHELQKMGSNECMTLQPRHPQIDNKGLTI